VATHNNLAILSCANSFLQKKILIYFEPNFLDAFDRERASIPGICLNGRHHLHGQLAATDR
jgi:hypothetical protein